MASWEPDEALSQGTVDERTEARLHAHRGEAPYPVAPLASRRAEPRLFLATGDPNLTPDERYLLDEARRIFKAVDYARAEMRLALDTDNPVLCVSACRRFLAIGELLGDKARFAS